MASCRLAKPPVLNRVHSSVSPLRALSRPRTIVVALAFLVLLPRAGAAVTTPANDTAPLAHSAPTGSGAIEGLVKDAKTGEPLAYVNVALRDTKLGTMSKVDGSFEIAGIAPGHYVIHVSLLGYTAVSQEVIAGPRGRTRTLIVLTDTDVAVLEPIQVTDRNDRVDVESSTSETRMDARTDFKQRAINSIEELLAKQSGVIMHDGQLHVRGGRPGDTKKLVDGLPATDPFVGSNSLQVAFSSLSEISLLSGAFDAEFGEAQSGIINMTTAEGGQRYSGLVKFMTDDFGAPDKTYYNSDDLVVGMGGPLLGKSLRYYASGEASFTDTYLPLDRPRPKRDILGVTFADRQNNRYRGQGKLSYLVGGRSDKKLTLEALLSRDETQPYLHHFSRAGFWSQQEGHWWFEPLDTTYAFFRGADHIPDVTTRTGTYNWVWNQSLSTHSFYSMRGSYFTTNDRRTVGGKSPSEYDSFNSVEDVDPANLFFAVSGDYPQWMDYTTKQWTTKGDLTSQVNATNKLKAGYQLQYYDLNMWNAFFPSVDEPTGIFRDDYHVNAWGGSIYMQDRLRHEGMVINCGVRFDWFDPGARATRIGNATRAALFDAPADVSFENRIRKQLSPRVGMAYPISDRDVLHFHYGRFFQLPTLDKLYGGLGQPQERVIGAVGNVFIEPEKTIAYELGIDHEITDALALDATIFYKDIFGLIGTANPTQGALAAVGAQPPLQFVNRDYGSVRGFEFKLDRPLTNRFGGSVVYTFARAAGVSSDINQGLLVGIGRQEEPPIREQPLDWNRTHAMSANLLISDPGVWVISTDWTYLSGAPFTPHRFNERRTDPNLINSMRLPPTNQVDVRANKLYSMYGQEFRLFAEGSNVLDRKNIRNLDPDFWPTNDPLYEVYFTESGGVGGAYSLSSVSASGGHELFPLGDPRVYDPGRSIKAGLMFDW
ncbi:MAG: TonB-dependent receptor [bacterium]